MFSIDWAAASDYATVGEFVLGFLTFCVVVFAMVHGLPRLFNHGRVLFERNFYKDEVRMMEVSLRSMREAADTLVAIDGRLSDMERVQIVSIRYIADLLVFIQVGDPTTPIPQLPAELRDEVLEALKERDQHRTDAKNARSSAADALLLFREVAP